MCVAADTHTMTQTLGHDCGPFMLTPEHGSRNWQRVRKKKCSNSIPEDKEKGTKQQLEVATLTSEHSDQFGLSNND